MAGGSESSNAGYNFLALVIASGILGYGIDKFFPTAPWGLLGFLVIGFVYATYKAQKAMNSEDGKTGSKKDDKKA